VFIDFPTEIEAFSAFETMQGYHFDAKNIFAIELFSDIERMANWNDLHVDPRWTNTFRGFVFLFVSEFVLTFYQKHMRSWFLYPKNRDQFVSHPRDQVLIHWHGRPSQVGVAHSKRVRSECGY
jgi:translation initiation factor 3 subunit B